MPIDPEEAAQFHGQDGQFATIKKLLPPGGAMRVQLLDIVKNFKTKYPLKDKDYSYRIIFVDDHGAKRLMDLNGRDSIRQFVNALYPQGPTNALVPCEATISRRTERKTTQSEIEVVRVEVDSEVDSSDALPI